RWIAGRSLHQLIQDGDRAEALRALRIAADGVAHAHARGVVHRDLSPGNVIVGEHRDVGLIDWGVAALEGDTDAPRSAGTPGYAAPEQTRGAPPHPTADVYGLGRLLLAVVGDLDDRELAAIIERATD